MIKDDCIFCKLANGIFDTNTVYEDEDFRVILDIEPASRGHALVLPKKHFANALEADDETLGAAMKLAARTGRALKEAFGCDGINILQNNGEAAGQTVFHLHVHVIPRWEKDTVQFEYKKNSFSDEEMKATAADIGKYM
ncbi:MAG: HIT family protein [Butyrivibrio sp.]|nr:HIT family protein [Butyrivibrio sp.]